jgi:lipoprotein-anchoring transpeptidase ErfK/SrfK
MEQAAPAPMPDDNPEPANEPEPAPAQPPPPPSPYSIEIDLGSQRAYLLDDGHIISQSPISSGRPGHLTPTGNFSVIQKDLNHFSNLYGSFVDKESGRVVKSGADSAMPTPKGCKFVPAPMKWFMRFDGASGMHAGILPGYAASHGCIRMPASKAELFYNTVDVGTPVHVFGVAPPPEFQEEKRPQLMAAAHTTPLPRKHPWWVW